MGFSGDLNLYRYVGNNPISHNDPLGLFDVDLSDVEKGFKRRGYKGAIGILTSPLIDRLPPCAIRGAAKTVSAYGDVQLGIWMTTVGVALIPTTPTIVGGVASGLLIAGGVAEIGLGISFGVAGFVEFLEYGGFEGLQKELSGYMNFKCSKECQ